MNLELYEGKGKKLSERKMELPGYKSFAGVEDPEKYIAPPGLCDAVNVALTLGQPLLITGKPGTGKTRLAGSIAWELGLDLLEFHTKTTSTASDLFYYYDAIRRFQDSQLNERMPIENYITCRALGTAILLTNPTEQAKKILPEGLKDKGPARSVVLIDEIDKAPRDLPNDVLNEIEDMRFQVKETTWKPFVADHVLRPILVLTSNSEKNLPDAFLRRCVFYHIDFPDMNALKRIIKTRFKDDPDFALEFTNEFIEGALEHFNAIRKLNLKKKPATAECIAWISILKSLGIDMKNLQKDQGGKLVRSYSVLAKNRDDLGRMEAYLSEILE